MVQVIELRNYLLAESATADFIRYFEAHFLFSQRCASTTACTCSGPSVPSTR